MAGTAPRPACLPVRLRRRHKHNVRKPAAAISGAAIIVPAGAITGNGRRRDLLSSALTRRRFLPRLRLLRRLRQVGAAAAAGMGKQRREKILPPATAAKPIVPLLHLHLPLRLPWPRSIAAGNDHQANANGATVLVSAVVMTTSAARAEDFGDADLANGSRDQSISDGRRCSPRRSAATFV